MTEASLTGALPTSALTVAVAQLDDSVGTVPANITRVRELVARASAAGAQLVITPELSLTGYDLGGLVDRDRWFTIDDPRLDGLRTACSDESIWAVVGVPLIHGDNRFLASLLLTPDGTVTVAPKTYLHGAEVDWFTPGAGPVVVDITTWRVGLSICFDTSVPGHAAAAARAGAHLYAASAVFVEGEERSLAGRMSERARENALYTLVSNVGGRPLGRRSAGGSGAWGPDGAQLAVAAGRGEELIVLTLEPPLSSGATQQRVS